MLDSKKRLVYSLVILLIIGGSFYLGFRNGKKEAVSPSIFSSIDHVTPPPQVPVDFNSFWKAWQILDEKFAPSSTSTKDLPTSQERVWGAIGGMVDSMGDPYTVFLPPEEAEIFESDIAGNFEGVGMEIGIRDGILTVIAPLKGTPAYRAGIKSGDKILKIDDTFTDKLNTDQAVRLIRGPGGSKVKLLILKEGSSEPTEVSLTRTTIDIPTIDYNLRGDGVFVIHLYNFSANSPNLFRAALREFVRTGSDKLVLDLRGNPGGYLEAAVDMASWFLSAGQVVVREEYGDGRDQIIHRSRGYDIFSNLKMAILVDQGSASASEILAGALSEQGIATLVGAKTFGKGSVQELVKITPDSSLKVTIAQWLTPNGNSISANGLSPQIEVARTAEDQAAGRDPQLAAAVAHLLKQ